MLKSKGEIVDWLINNEALMHEVMNNVQKRLIKNSYLFDEEIKDQYVQEVKNMITIEMGNSLGVAIENFHEHITPEMFEKYMNIIERRNVK